MITRLSNINVKHISFGNSEMVCHVFHLQVFYFIHNWNY